MNNNILKETGEENIITGSHDNNVILQQGDSKTIFKGLKTSVVCIDFTVSCFY